jgi:hypothetical protein
MFGERRLAEIAEQHRKEQPARAGRSNGESNQYHSQKIFARSNFSAGESKFIRKIRRQLRLGQIWLASVWRMSSIYGVVGEVMVHTARQSVQTINLSNRKTIVKLLLVIFRSRQC